MSVNNLIVLKSPEKLSNLGTTVFLAGSIEMGKAIDWQTQIENKLKDKLSGDTIVTLYNPRRDDWDCVDSETKAMTKDGLKSYNDLKLGDLILTYNIEKNNLEYSKIQKLNRYDLKNEEVLEFKRNDDTFYFTKNHKILSRKSSRDNSIAFYKANKWVGKDDSVRIPTDLYLPSNGYNKLLDGEFTNNHFKLYAWLLSEGSLFRRTNSNTYNIVIAQYIKNNIKVKKIKEVLDNLSLKYSYDNRQFKLQKDGVDFILGFLGFEKYKIPDWIKNATPQQKRIFILEYGLGDGSFVDGKLKYVAFSEKYRQFAEEFQQLCFESGVSTKLRTKTSGFEHPVINIYIHNFDKIWYTMKYNRTIKYDGVMWCPTTKNKTWVAYRNGTPFITGNSSWEQKIENDNFREQVEWELNALSEADKIIVYIDPETTSPITLLEIGLHAESRKMCVCCPEGFYRKGNVDIVCNLYNIPMVENIDGLVKFILDNETK